MKAQLRQIMKNQYPEIVENGDSTYNTVYLGSFLSLDPCGRYHHVLSNNGLTRKCENFWARLERATNEIGAWIESGEGNALDVFLCWG